MQSTRGDVSHLSWVYVCSVECEENTYVADMAIRRLEILGK